MKQIYVISFIFIFHSYTQTLFSEEDSSESQTSNVEKVRDFAKEKLNINANLSFSSELDDNAKKEYTTSSSVDDVVFRLFLNSNGQYMFDRSYIGFKYQGGAKKYMNESGEDTVINHATAGYHFALLPGWMIGTVGNFKIKNERDVGEDFYLLSNEVYSKYKIPKIDITTNISAKYTYFDFIPDDLYSFQRGRYGLTASVPVWGPLLFQTGYHYQNQYFFEPYNGQTNKRKDDQHEVSSFIGFDKEFIARAGLVYQVTDSNVSNFSNTAYRLVVQFNYILPWDITFLFLGTLQLKQYSDRQNTVQEGERALLTNQEDENFNSVICKISKEIVNHWFIEAKYSRFSNEFSDNEDPFKRSLYNIGIRYEF